MAEEIKVEKKLSKKEAKKQLNDTLKALKKQLKDDLKDYKRAKKALKKAEGKKIKLQGKYDKALAKGKKPEKVNDLKAKLDRALDKLGVCKSTKVDLKAKIDKEKRTLSAI